MYTSTLTSFLALTAIAAGAAIDTTAHADIETRQVGATPGFCSASRNWCVTTKDQNSVSTCHFREPIGNKNIGSYQSLQESQCAIISGSVTNMPSGGSLGTLRPVAILHDPTRVHCGPDDPVQGYVQLSYIPSRQMPHDTQLFSPCRIFLTLRGRLKVTVEPGRRRSTQHSLSNRTARARVPLFSTPELLVHEGPVQLSASQACNYPFSLSFPGGDATTIPDHVVAMCAPWDPADDMFSMAPRQPLPPTMSMQRDEIAGFADHVGAQYELATRVEMPGIDVEFSYNLIDSGLNNKLARVGGGVSAWRGTKVLYERPRVDRPVPVDLKHGNGWLFVKDRDLISCAKDVHRGQPLLVQVRVQPSESKSTTLVMPAIELVKVTVAVETRVQARVFAEARGQLEFDKNEPAAEETVFVCKVGPQNDQSSPADGREGNGKSKGESAMGNGLFSADNDWTHVLTFLTITRNLGSSFTSPCIRRTYMFRVKSLVRIAGIDRHEQFEQPLPITSRDPAAV
ncbi:uncharacterized protein B0I36DRAFT_436541 [Microdochium trichocladiopsis]|uniref:Uncharacterized protein n=1 Tax=Microdochium trichocladiopsis TaxID=1682393 RepID=A0A9P8XSZ6_9PEZI|nr:uncharacterized protein B0I36DRAFT_436541 [Microdochium trichocladiopsis]KAH7014635.1 hypothetical protein B0I36DRAFT_436541 [Microdochium trichocladiopsis]